ncbi:hypothetical protein [Gandjariella thermophila]|uniref:Uncharacterized protein n=1 Tax=Gandjariella thermophila TaxID=1931992 RepID=A0A4D4JE87_9PSEU|nr:hypothetical protein [Gandjariella thermophila]GDY33964.1 hypothetical protein GTS_55970 [Gandjariella thermophila]
MTSNQPEHATHRSQAAAVCSLIAHQLDRSTKSLLPGYDIYVYGGSPDDTPLVPTPTTSVILLVRDGRAHWYEIEVRDIDPTNPAQAYRLDLEVLDILARRAGIAPPC